MTDINLEKLIADLRYEMGPFCVEAADAIEKLKLDMKRRDVTVGTISNALSHAEHELAMWRSKAGELENENKRLKLDLEEARRDALMVERGTKAWSDSPCDWLEDLRGNDISSDKAEDLCSRLESLSKMLESSGRIDEREYPDAYATILDAMKAARQQQG